MKKKLITILVTIVVTITLGYLFFLSGLLALLASKYIAGKSAGERGKVGSFVIPFRRWGINLHHWLYALGLITLSSIIGIHFLTPAITYGLLGGVVFQGIYYYDDWRVIIIKKRQTKARRPLMAAVGSEDGNHES